MGEARLLEQRDVVLAAAVPGRRALPEGRRGPLADAVDRQDGGLLVRRAEEGAGGVRQVVLDEEDLLGRDGDLTADPV